MEPAEVIEVPGSPGTDLQIPVEVPQPLAQENIIHQSETTSLHYPFPKHQSVIVGDREKVFARIKQTRSGKPHVTGTLPLNVAPDAGEEIPREILGKLTNIPPVAQLQKPADTATKIKESPQQLSEEEKELYRKQRKKERRLARKAKRAEAEAALKTAGITSKT